MPRNHYWTLEFVTGRPMLYNAKTGAPVFNEFALKVLNKLKTIIPFVFKQGRDYRDVTVIEQDGVIGIGVRHPIDSFSKKEGIIACKERIAGV